MLHLIKTHFYRLHTHKRLVIMGPAVVFLISSALFTALFMDFVDNFLNRRILRRIVTYPIYRDYELRDRCPLDSKAYREECGVDSLVNDIKSIPPSHVRYVREICTFIFSNKNDFYVDQVDRIVITRAGFDLLHINLGERGYGRYAFIDLRDYTGAQNTNFWIRIMTCCATAIVLSLWVGHPVI